MRVQVQGPKRRQCDQPVTTSPITISVASNNVPDYRHTSATVTRASAATNSVLDLYHISTVSAEPVQPATAFLVTATPVHGCLCLLSVLTHLHILLTAFLRPQS